MKLRSILASALLTLCALSAQAGPFGAILAAYTTTASFATPAFVQGASQISFNTCAYSSPQAVGDLNVIVIGWNQSGFSVNTVTDTLGNTYAAVASATSIGNASQQLYYAAGILGGTNTITITWTGGTMPTGLDIRCGEWSGVSTSSPLDQQVAASSASGTALSSGATSATTQATELLVGAGYVSSNITATGSYTQRVFSAGNNNIQDKVVTSTGAQTSTATQGTSSFWIESLATFKAAGSSPPPSGTPLLTYLTSLMTGGKLLSGFHFNLFGGTSGSTAYGGQLNQVTPSVGTATPANMTMSSCATGSGGSCTSGLTNTGKTPAIVGSWLTIPQATCSSSPTVAQSVQAIEDSLAAGNIVLVTAVSPTPTANACSAVGTGAEFPNVLKVGGVCTNATCNAFFYGYGCTVSSPCGGVWSKAQEFNAIAAVNPRKMIYRPFHENDVGPSIFWWGTGGVCSSGCSGPTNAQLVALYKQEVDDLTADGVANLLYAYSMNWFSGAYSNNDPGSSYRSLVMIDFYCCSPTDSTAAIQSAMTGSLPNGGAGWAYANSLGIPVIAGEVGNSNASNPSITAFTYDTSHWGNAMQGYPNGSNLVGTVTFTQNWNQQGQLNDSGYLNNSIVRSGLPPLQLRPGANVVHMHEWRARRQRPVLDVRFKDQLGDAA